MGSGNRSLYDPNGNPQRIILGAPGQQTERVYAYHARTNRVAGTTGTGVDYRYNPSGNMTRSETAHADGRIDLTWDGFLNLPARVTHPGWDETTEQTFLLYGPSERVLKRTESDGAVTTTFYVHGLSAQPLYTIECIELTAGGGECWSTAYVWGPEGLLAERRVFGGPGVVERFAVKDHLGSIRLLVDAADETVYAWRDYAPFGALMRGEVTGDLVRYGYTGQEDDRESGLLNYRARLYDPAIGIFLATDPAGQTPSSYVYAGNNPISFVDPDGEWFIEAMLIGAFFGARSASLNNGNILRGAAIGAVSGAAGAAVSAAVSPALASYLGWHTGSVSIGVIAGHAGGGALGGMTGYGLTEVLSGNRLSAGGFAMAALSSGLYGGLRAAYMYHNNPQFKIESLSRTLSYGLGVTEGGSGFHERAGMITARLFGWNPDEVFYDGSLVGPIASFSTNNTMTLYPEAFGSASAGVVGYGYYHWGEYGPQHWSMINYDLNKFATVVLHESYHPKLLIQDYGSLVRLEGREYLLHELAVSRAVLESSYIRHLGTSGIRAALHSYTSYLRMLMLHDLGR